MAYLAKNKNMAKFHTFDQNHGLAPWKYPNFSIFLTSRFYSLESIFLFQNNVKLIFLAYLAKNKNMAKFHTFDQNHGLAPWKYPNFSIFLTSRFYSLESNFFFQNIVKHIFLIYFAKNRNMAENVKCLRKIKIWPNFTFLTKTMG